MSEYFGMTIEIGGTLSAGLIPEFLEELTDELSDINGETTEQELRQAIKKNSSIKWYAQSNYGECDSLKRFCRAFGLSYIHTSEAKDEYNAQVCYWTPGMPIESSNNASQDGLVTIPITEVRPLVMALLAYAKDPENSLPLLITEKSGLVKNAVEKGLKKNPKEFLKIIEEELLSLLAVEPELPPFMIKE
jgi:hypothetical protein